MQTREQPRYPQLFSLWGYRYTDALLSDVERAAWQHFLRRSQPDAATRETLLQRCQAVQARARAAQQALRETRSGNHCWTWRWTN